MGFIIVFVMAAGMAVFAISVAILALSLGLALGALKTGTSGNLSKRDLGLLALMSLVYLVAAYLFLRGQTTARPGFWDQAILIYLCIIITSFAVSAVALGLRLFRHLGRSVSVGGSTGTAVTAGVMIAGFAACYSALAMTGDFFLFKIKRPAPLEMTFDGEPTHCVYATSGVNFYKSSHDMSKQLYRLEQGDKVRLNTSAWKASEGWRQFAIHDGGETVLAYALGSGIVGLKSDGSCHLPK